MNNILHIVNGDCTAQILAKTSLKGDVVVWREMLCEGPLHKNVASDEFWKKRYAFFEEEHNIQKLEYFDKTIKEIVKIENIEAYNEVVLWFEFDLFCQVNLLALCSYLLQNFRKDINYYLVCTGKVKGKEKLQTLSDFLPEEYSLLYKNKVKLTRNNLLFAENCWNVYVENNLIKLQQFNFDKSSKFQYLQQAILQHLKRFPSENGLNQIQNKIMSIINSEVLSAKEIVHKLLIWQSSATVYGFGDLQYYTYLKKLSDYVEVKDEKYYLTAKAKLLISE
ncbi:DUF1835 domain-containing protein [Lutibacter sp. B1]|uniref:DUF1835 domain-containing protein n=1 Tax=Lutibacter sp. B1 TaxID=2725996 RepID=UPI001456EDAF|nr:DUF1835 domain-containing protein [Lutibacter sp. B1]NLP57835.1 DUF1835 domain-containing protein [Lutibacter sp. B1]